MEKINKALWAAVLAVGMLGGCAGEQATDDYDTLDPALEQIEGKGDGVAQRVDPARTYRLEIAGVEAAPSDEWTVRPDLYVLVADAHTPVCAGTIICDYDGTGRLNLDSGRERTFTGRELRDGVQFEVRNAGGSGGGIAGVVDDLIGRTHLRILGADVSFKVKPFGEVKSIQFRARWVF